MLVQPALEVELRSLSYDVIVLEALVERVAVDHLVFLTVHPGDGSLLTMGVGAGVCTSLSVEGADRRDVHYRWYGDRIVDPDRIVVRGRGAAVHHERHEAKQGNAQELGETGVLHRWYVLLKRFADTLAHNITNVKVLKNI